MKIYPVTEEAKRLFLEGSIVLAEIEATGIRVDTEYLARAMQDTQERIRDLEASLRKDEVFSLWRRKYGSEANLGSSAQLGEILFGVMKIPCTSWTAGDSSKRTFPSKEEALRAGCVGTRPQTTDEELAKVDLPFVKEYGRLAKQRLRLARLEGVERETIDGYIHPIYNLTGAGRDDKGGASSFRSSSQFPNAQNFDKRNPEAAELVRSCFIPLDECLFVEVDFKGAEVSLAAVATLDPVLIDYVNDKTKDMHRDLACQLYKLKKNEVSKDTRYGAKNGFTFAEFYGSYYAQCAPILWEFLEKLSLKRATDGIPLKQHLAEKGITELGPCNKEGRPVPGTFEYHVKEVEEDFWGRRFKVYAEWKKRRWIEYQQEGSFSLLTGFRCVGVYRKNQVINTPIQGAAFHCLLKCLIILHKWLKKYKMKSRICGQVHDSMIGSFH